MRPLDRRELLERTGRLALGAGAVAALPGLEALAGASLSGPLRALAREVEGPVVTPGSGAYAQGRLLFDTRFDASRPRAIVYCESAEDVQKTVRWARKQRVRIAPRCGGHSYGGYSTTSGVVVDVTRMKRVRARANGSAVIGAGALLIDVYTQLGAHGVTIPAGSCPSVGIAGLTLGGGASYAGRKLGLTCDNVTGLSIVTANGKLLHCSAGEHPDLFWACRGGGGGNFGIVTSFRFRTHAVSNVAFYQVVWPWANAADAVRAWQAFAPHAPDELYSTLFMSTAAKGPGKVPVISSGGQFFGTQAELAALIAPLASTGSPTRVVVGTLSYMDAVLRWAGCHPTSHCHTVQRLAFKGKSDYVNTPLSNAAIATLLAGLEANQDDPTLGRAELLFDPYGGAINRLPKAATAFVHRDALFSIQYFSTWAAGSGAAANLKWIRDLYAAMRPHVSGFAYQNYIDPDLASWKHAYYGSNLPRLAAVKRKYDPRNVFRFAQSIPTRLY